MSLAQWQANGWLQPHRTSRQEVDDLFRIVDRDLRDAQGGISADWRFGIAYNAALKLCTVLLYAEGCRVAQSLQHYRTIQALPLIIGAARRNDAVYLDACRAKRNRLEYDSVGGVSEADADELIAFGQGLRSDVLAWLQAKHPALAPT